MGRVLTLGRQDLWSAPEDLESLLRTSGRWREDASSTTFREEIEKSEWRLETFLRWLGAEEVLACDASDYEGAGLIHDMNRPIPERWCGAFDLVIDGGTLEHVFNVPVALGNCMRMLKRDGHLILFTPANNYCGHGFYQFSPELFWRTLSPANGFRMERMHAAVDTTGFASFLGVKYSFPIRGPRYEVSDPADVHDRVLLVNRSPALLFIHAVKETTREPFAEPPMQSDYRAQWEVGAGADPLAQSTRARGVVSLLRRLLPESTCRELLPRLAGLLDPFRSWRFRRRLSFANRAHYRRAPRG